MKWQKYTQLVATNPIAARCLDGLVGPPILLHGGTHPDFTLQQWVEQRVDYVAFRPWERLSMDTIDVSGNDAHAAHTVHYHIEGEEGVCSRMRWLTNSEGNLKTLSEVLVDIVEWYGLYWARQPDRPLVFDAVARKSSAWLKGARHSRQAISIWIPPAGFQP